MDLFWMSLFSNYGVYKFLSWRYLIRFHQSIECCGTSSVTSSKWAAWELKGCSTNSRCSMDKPRGGGAQGGMLGQHSLPGVRYTATLQGAQGSRLSFDWRISSLIPVRTPVCSLMVLHCHQRTNMCEWLNIHLNEHNILWAVKQTYRWHINASPLTVVAGTQLILLISLTVVQTDLLQNFLMKSHKVDSKFFMNAFQLLNEQRCFVCNLDKDRILNTNTRTVHDLDYFDC